MQYLEDQY
jgi:hypothetical protein